jgi:predicted RNase H-like HicB family nuclease
MKVQSSTANGTWSQLVVIRPEPAGQFTASLVGLPELHATATTREDALDRLGHLLGDCLASGQLAAVTVPLPTPTVMKWFGHTRADDPEEQAYLEELARNRQEDLERTLREYDQE